MKTFLWIASSWTRTIIFSILWIGGILTVYNMLFHPSITTRNYTLQFKLIDGSWTTPKTYRLEEGTYFICDCPRGGSVVRSVDNHPLDGVYMERAAIDYKILPEILPK